MLLSSSGLKKLDRRCGGRSVDAFLVCADAPSSCPEGLTLLCRPNKLEMRCCRGLFAPDSVARMLRHLSTLVASFQRCPGVALCQLPLQLPGTADELEVAQWADGYSGSIYAAGAKGSRFSAEVSMTSMTPNSIESA